MAFISRFNPKPGILDLWHELRKPNPYRWPILFVSTFPFALIGFWLSQQTFYAAPEKPQIDYITTFDPDRTDEEIMASNIANQEVRELREAHEAELAQRKRDLYKAIGAASGMDVEAIEDRAEANRAAEEAAEQARLEELRARRENSNDNGDDSSSNAQAEEGANP